MVPGESLEKGEVLCSEDGFAFAMIQQDGNFVVKTVNGDITVSI